MLKPEPERIEAFQNTVQCYILSKKEIKHVFYQYFYFFSEMLNHATMKVMEAEKQKTDSEAEHLQRAAFYTAAEQACQRLEKRLKKNVVKSHHYFEQKDAFNKTLEAQKFQVQSLQSKVSRFVYFSFLKLSCLFKQGRSLAIQRSLL